VVGYQKERVKTAIPQNDKISFVEQIEQKGTGHAVMVCSKLFAGFEGNLFILCGDIPLLSEETLEKLLTTHRENEAACTVLTIKLENPASYGRIIRDENDRIAKIVEYKDATNREREVNEINTGIYCFNSKLLFNALEQIDNDNRQQEYYLTDTLAILNSMGKKVVGLITDHVDEVTGINSQKELARLEMSYYARIRDHWLANGVSIENPASIIIGDEVNIEPDVDIGSGTIIKGRSKIEKGVSIGPYSYLDNTVIGETPN
jgi:UDP-N-acetylglucosamine diphosphorylase/glucosamine-1-phosphate N-acetyltransferase